MHALRTVRMIGTVSKGGGTEKARKGLRVERAPLTCAVTERARSSMRACFCWKKYSRSRRFRAASTLWVLTNTSSSLRVFWNSVSSGFEFVISSQNVASTHALPLA